ncbi:unnamed protein product [Effrenium voratum]|nr:unnamed protein product [Effrenium voratum]
MILKVRPDKLVQHANESPEDFVERLKQEEGKAKMYIHHYQILSVFLANRDAPCWAQRKDLIQEAVPEAGEAAPSQLRPIWALSSKEHAPMAPMAPIFHPRGVIFSSCLLLLADLYSARKA